MTATRTANVVWENDLVHGSGRVKLGSGALQEFPVTWASRTEIPGGKTSPEELLAAAQAACFAMAFSATLSRKGKSPERLDVSASCTFDNVALKVSSMEITARGVVQGMNDSEFKVAAEEAERICPVANAIRNNVKITLNAGLV